MAESAPQDPAGPSAAKTHLRFWDVVSLIVGIVVGTSIFKSPPGVFANVGSPWQACGVWLLGGVVSLAGALCYAELAAAWPHNGGDYEYLSRAFGGWWGFQFAWAQLLAVLTGSIGAMAYAFADYGAAFLHLPSESVVWLAAGSIVAMTVANGFGLVVGKTAQNLLTVAKGIGLGAIVLAGVWGGSAGAFSERGEIGGGGFGLAMVFVLYSYGGWSHAAYVASEIEQPRWNIPRTLLVGITLITFVYLAVNAAFVGVLGFDGARSSRAPAVDVLRLTAGDRAADGVGLLVMVSALGAINGMVLTGARVYAALGRDYRPLAWLGGWDAEHATPLSALITQCGISLLLVFAVGTPQGQRLIDRSLTLVGAPTVAWSSGLGGFETLVIATAPLFWTFFVLTALALFVLRLRCPDTPRPFVVPGYPLTPTLFVATCGYMLWASVSYAGTLALFNLVPLVTGSLLYAFCRRKASCRASAKA